MSAKQSAWSRFATKVENFNILSVFDPPPRTLLPRKICVNTPLPEEAHTTAPRFAVPFYSKSEKVELPDGSTVSHDRKIGFGHSVVPRLGWHFDTNQVLTSKYNIFTFLPRNLLEQFRRVANVFFLALVILQFFPRFTTVSPGLSALPLIVVLTITAAKDGYEDFKRHQSDRSINNIKTLVLGGSFVNPNLTQKKARSIGLPGFITRFFMKNTYQREEEEKEEDRVERKKHFWGKKHIKRPDDASKQDADGKGTTKKKGIFSGAGGPSPSAEPKLPHLEHRAAGDFFDDENAHGGPPVAHSSLQAGNTPDRAMWVKRCWEDVRVGDFVRLHGDDSIPADMIICATSEEENVCYVETKNLDGETNLKSRQAIQELTHLNTSSQISEKAKFVIDSEAPNVNMFSYNGAVTMLDGQTDKHGNPLKSAVTLNSMLLRGTVLRNTDWVVGIVVMSGRDSKIVLNSGGTPSKRSRVERAMNPMVFINLFLLGLMCAMCAIVDHYWQVEMYPQGAYWLFMANRSSDNPNINALITFCNAMIAFQNIVPISLYISIEFVRVIQAFFIYADDEIMYRTETTKRRTMARSWNLSDDLGQIEYIFSDKTGTLTQNVMLFRQCSIAGTVYSGVKGELQESETSTNADTRVSSGLSGEIPLIKGENRPKVADTGNQPFFDEHINSEIVRCGPQANHIYSFFNNLALCHTVLAGDEEGGIAYKAQSPDEAALVKAAADAGFVFLGRDRNTLRVQTPLDDDPVEYEMLNVIEFSSARKRMSVIVRRVDDNSGKLLLLCKGADNIIFERLGPGQDELKKVTDGHLELFASEGLRTLCLAQKTLSEAEYDEWEREYHDAETLVEGREAAMEKVAEKLESDLTLLGSTAIEDRLQDGVPEAIADLKRAGLKIWVATGDKLETAIAIGKTCNLLSRDMNLVIIKGGAYTEPKSAYSQLRSAMSKFFEADDVCNALQNQPPGMERSASRTSGRRSTDFDPLSRRVTMMSGVSDIIGEDNGERPGGYGLVIDGSSLRHAFEEPFTKELLLELATRCRAVICCRVSPLQKALIVHLVKDNLGAMCLAIGDGANDVSMIQAADIGVGVAGEEGLQAVNSSDYAIGQFRFLKRLLLVHGHWSYMRNSSLIVNFFYKEIIGIGIIFFFQFYCAYSATTTYEYTFLLFWNVIWTIAPVIAIGIFDKNVSARVLMAIPELYKVGSQARNFGLLRFFWYMFDGTLQSAIIFFGVIYTYNTATPRKDGYDISLYEFSTIMCIAAVIACNCYNGLNTHSWNWWVLGSVLFGSVLVVLYTAVYSSLAPSLMYTEVYGMNQFWWGSAYFWLSNLITIIVSLIPMYLITYIRQNYLFNDIHIVSWIDKMEPNHNWEADPWMPRIEAPAKFDAKGNEEEEDPGFDTKFSRRESDTFVLNRVSTSISMTHDMRSGHTTSGAGRGYGFDQSDNMLPAPIRRYTSRGSASSAPVDRRESGRNRSGSFAKLNPFARSGESSANNRARSGSIRALFSPRRTSVVLEHHEPTSTPSRMPTTKSTLSSSAQSKSHLSSTPPKSGELSTPPRGDHFLSAPQDRDQESGRLSVSSVGQPEVSPILEDFHTAPPSPGSHVPSPQGSRFVNSPSIERGIRAPRRYQDDNS